MSDSDPFFNSPPSTNSPTSGYSSFMTQTPPIFSSSFSPSSFSSPSPVQPKSSQSVQVEDNKESVAEVRLTDDNCPATVDLQIESDSFTTNDFLHSQQQQQPRCTITLSGKAFFDNKRGEDRVLKTHRDQFSNCYTAQDKVDSAALPKMLLSSDRKDILKVAFNQECNMFTCATEHGLLLYNLDPLLLKSKLDFSDVGSIGSAEMLHRSNMIALVAGGQKPKYADNTVLVWDDYKKRFVAELTFSSPVISVKLRKEKLFVVEKNQIQVFNFPKNPKKIFTIETGDNLLGLCEISPYVSSERQILVCPGHKAGTVLIYDLNSIEPGTSSTPVCIRAHKTDIACLSINNQGTLIATASKKGTLIRVYDTVRQVQLVELRRGVDPATVYCMSFSIDSDFLCASSDKGTVHIFALKDTHLNRRSKFSNIGIPNTYVNSQWAFATFTVAAECACICAFGPKLSVYAVCVDGTFHKYNFSLDGNCNRESFDVFVDLALNDEFENFLKPR